MSTNRLSTLTVTMTAHCKCAQWHANSDSYAQYVVVSCDQRKNVVALWWALELLGYDIPDLYVGCSGPGGRSALHL